MCIQREIGFPEKNKITVPVMHSNKVIDLSGIYGGQTFSERPLKFVFQYYGSSDPESIDRTYTQVVNWLMSYSGKAPIYDDRMKRYYYLAELVSSPSFEELLYKGTLTISFTAYPFRFDSIPEGDDDWDTFDFDFDVAQDVQFKVEGSKEITLYNVGNNVAVPTITASTAFQVVQDNREISLPAGRHEHSRIRLLTGENKLVLNGTGTVEFLFYKELI